MKLLKMTLDNFKGIRHIELDFDGKNANIYGANGTGKTTIYDAFTWLLFGRSSEERANFSPKTITFEGYTHNLGHSVECDIEIDGEVVTFRRVYHEVYKKTRGRAEAVLSGHTTDYWIDGVPKKEKEYQQYWQSVFPNEEVVKLLTMPYYFPEQLHWEKRRGLLLEICGSVSDLAIMESDTELSELPAILGKQPFEGFKRVVKAQKADINRELELLPARIDEAAKAIPNTAGLSEAEIDKQLADIRRDIWEAEKERAALLAGDDRSAQIRERISELNTALAEAKGRYIDRQNEVSAASHAKIYEARNELAKAENELEVNKILLAQKKRCVAGIEAKRGEILTDHRRMQEEYARQQAEQFDESATVCDKCGQALPTDRVNELREAFNERKSSRLTELTEQMNALVERGKSEASKDMLADAQRETTECEALISAAESVIAELKSRLEEAKEELHDTALPPFEQTAEYKDITAKIAAVKETERTSAPDTSAIDEEIAGYRAAESELIAKKSALETEKTQHSRIAELEAEEKKLGAAYDEAEHALYLCEKFTRVKSALLNEKINEKFRTVRFQLFRQNITNDGIDDICDVLVPTENGAFIPFADANKAARLNAGVEIIGVLCEHYGIELPVFVDNAESVTHIIPINGQLIRLVVSESDKELRLETL